MRAAPVMVTVAVVVDGLDVPPPLGAGPGETTCCCGVDAPPPPQLCSASAAIATRITLLAFLIVLLPRAQLSITTPAHGSDRAMLPESDSGCCRTGKSIDVVASAEMVTVELAGDPPGVTLCGAKLQFMPTGSPLHENETLSLNAPFCGVIVSANLAVSPRLIV